MDALATCAELMARIPTAPELVAIATALDKELVATRARLVELEKVEATGGGELSEIRSSIADCHAVIGKLEEAIDQVARRRDNWGLITEAAEIANWGLITEAADETTDLGSVP